MVNRGIDILLGETVVSTNEVMIPGAFIVGGIIAFLFGVILVGIFALPALAKGLSFIFLIPLERSLKRICYRNLMRNKRRTINTFLMIAIGLSFSVSITTITNSISEGTYPGSKTILGGDIQLHPGIYMDQEFTRDLKELSHIQESCLYRASLDTERIFYLGMGDVFGNKVDDYGYYKDYDYYSHNRYFSLGIVNGTAYYNINDDAILKLKETGHLSKETVFSRLDSIPSIILQDELEGRLDKEVGDNVTLKMEGTSMNLTIIGYADVLPGLPWTYGMNAFGGYYTNPSETDLCGMISWNTYFTMVEQLFNNMDLVVKNRFWQEGLEYTGGPGDKYWGIFGFPMNQTLVRDLLSEYLNNGTISSLGCQTTNFIPIATEYYNERPFNYHEDQNQMSEHLFSSAWRTLNSSLLAIDTSSGDEFGKPLIKKVNASVPESNRSSVESILAWFDTQDSVNACIVNELLVEKSVDDIFDLLDRDDLYSIYQFDIGDEVRVPVNGTIVTYTVVATVESNWNYQYQSLLGNHSSPWIMNSKTMNFDAYKINELYPSLIDLFYMDSNTVMLSNTEFSKLFEGILDDIESLDDQEILPGLNLSALTLLNETMAYNGSEGDHSNLIHINLAPGINASRIQADLEMIFQGIPELENFTIFNPKKYFFEFTNYDKGIGFLGCKREDLEVGVTQIEQLFATRGLYFEDYMVDYYGKETYYFNYFVMLESLLDVITTVFNMVLAFAIAVSLVGLSISMLISMHQRRREIGTLRSVGFSKKDVLILIYGENMTLGVLGIVIGLFAGLFTANIMISQVPFTIFLPILFSPPISTYVINVLIIFGISLTASIIPAYRSMKMDIADVLKSPE